MTTEEINSRLAVLKPEPGDVLVVNIDAVLNHEQRNQVRASLFPTLTKLGCKVILLEKGMSLTLVKKTEVEDAA